VQKRYIRKGNENNCDVERECVGEKVAGLSPLCFAFSLAVYFKTKRRNEQFLKEVF
jgi:hypothetical protein